MLTELEGAILSEILYRGEQTSFQVRRSFADSPSLEWKGSAGAVYPAVKRLEGQTLLKARAKGDGRGSRVLSVTEKGREAMLEWACDPLRASSTGIDPFRVRAGIWLQLNARKRDRVLLDVRRQLQTEIAYLTSFARNKDTIERTSVDLAMRLQVARLGWIDELLDKPITAKG
jgi:DNA-binding PadR family transcriptional regulator